MEEREALPEPFAILSRMLVNHNVHFSEKQDAALFGISVGFAAVSFVLSLLVLLSYSVHKHLRTRSFALVAQLAIAEIGADISYFLGDPEDGSGVCTFQGFLQQLSQLATFLWATLIALQLYRKLVLRSPDLTFWKLCLVGYGLPVILALLPLTTGSYGQVGGWCWVEASANPRFDVGTMWRFLSFYAVLWVCIVLDVALMWEVRGYVKGLVASTGGHTSRNEGARRLMATVDRLKYYPLILIICWTPATINRIHNSAHPTSPLFVLSVFQVLFRSCQGIANAVTYGLTGPVRATWMRSLQGHAPSVYAAFASLGCVADDAAMLDDETSEEDEEGGGGGGGALADKMDSVEMANREAKRVEIEEAIMPTQDL